MNQKLTEMVLLLDRSGSMQGLEHETIGGYNSMVEKQRELEGEATVTTVLFDNHIEMLHDRVDIRKVVPLTREEYFVRGGTALLDALGLSIRRMVQVQRQMNPEDRAKKVIFVITTDGYENASQHFSYPEIRSMIAKERDVYGWEFIFLGANIDAAAEAEKFGIARERTAQFHADARGVHTSYRAISEALSEYRHSGRLSDDWNEAIQRDYKNRKKN
ncbi:MAG: hypothetical protein AVO33_07960 [delta proteobacterium ML8_F1]|nr:MAG: hypothetical protein AVO33_07960 [delta proteobacterium ML8_F1]